LAREGEWRRLEQTWHEREARLEKRFEAVEGDYRRLIPTVTSMGLCANTPDCADYDLGDRRHRPITQLQRTADKLRARWTLARPPALLRVSLSRLSDRPATVTPPTPSTA
jgi:hypothetical protein